MPFDKLPCIEVSPDLSKASLEGLSWLLRHKERWPRNHEWNFGWLLHEAECGTAGCALGIAQLVWCAEGLKPWGVIGWGEYFGLWDEEAYHIFEHFTYPCPASAVTPTMVADRIDAYLARKAA